MSDERVTLRGRANFDDVKQLVQVVDVHFFRWDYDLLYKEDRAEAMRVTAEIRERQGRLNENTLEIGRRLLEMKTLMHRHFTDWVSTEFGYGTTVTRQLMAIAERFGDKPELFDLFGSTALRLASSRQLSDVQVQQLAERAKEAGRKVKVVEVQEELAKKQRRSTAIRQRSAEEVGKAFRVDTEKEVGELVVEVVGGGPGKGEARLEGYREKSDIAGATRNWLVTDTDIYAMVEAVLVNDEVVGVWDVHRLLTLVRDHYEAKLEELRGG